MKKKLIFICEHPFTKFHTFKMELESLKKKKINFIINDLSLITFGNKFSNNWKTEKEKKLLKFSSLISWAIYFLKLDKREIIFWNNIKVFNFSTFCIDLLLRLSKALVITHLFFDIFSEKRKKNFNFIFERIKNYKFNLNPYLFFLKKFFFVKISNLIPYNKIILLSNHQKPEEKINISFKKLIKIDFNSYDYSNYIFLKKKKYKKKNYAIYIDGGGPYFSGDRHLTGVNKDYCNFDLYYGALNKFFYEIKKFFKIDLLIIPHPKYKAKNGVSLNPYFNKDKVVNNMDALPRLSSNCSFFINHFSTASSFAVASNKPIIFFYSSKYYKEAPSIKNARIFLSKKLNKKAIDICNFSMKEIKKSLFIDRRKYKQYKYNYLTPKNKLVENVTNAEILEKVFKKFK